MKGHAIRYSTLGREVNKHLLGGKGMLHLLLLAATGCPFSLDTQMLGQAGGPTIGQAAETGVFTLQCGPWAVCT